MQIDIKSLKKLLDDDTQSTILIDVRTQEEWDEERIAGAIHMPIAEMNIVELEIYKKDKLYIYCHSGGRSQLACELLRQSNFNAINVTGGIQTWIDSNFPTEN